MNKKGFYIVAPSILKVEEEFILKFKVLTEPYFVEWKCWNGKSPTFTGVYNESPRGIHYIDNVYSGQIQDVIVEIESRKIKFNKFHGVFKNDERKFGKISGLKFETPGIKFIKLIDSESGIETLSNPMLVCEEESEYKLFWADLHSQTFFSDGLRCPEELYLFAREESFLDIFSITDHAEQLSDYQWNYFKEVTNAYNEDGKFVTLVGLEWTDGFYGHRNVYYPGEDGPILRAREDNLKKVYETGEKYKALVIPHHSANTEMGVDWSKGYNPDVERLVEIYSVWGNSEIPEDMGNKRPIRNHGGEKKGQHVIDALNRGYKFGFVGGGDIHDGRPGDELHNLQENPPQYRNLYRQGITGIWAKKLTRKEIFKSLWERRCYATSNVRMILNFSINEEHSGSIIKNPSSKLSFKISGASEVPVEKVVIVADGKVYKKFDLNNFTFNIKFDEEFKGEKYFYVRVERRDGEMGWLSPIWMGG